MLQLHRCLRLLCLCGLVSIAGLTVWQMRRGKVSTGLLSGYLSMSILRHRQSGHNGTETDRDGNWTSAPGTPPPRWADWRSGYGSITVRFPKLYAALKPLGSAGAFAVNFTPPLAASLPKCQRPKSQNLVAELTAHHQQQQLAATGSLQGIDGGFWGPRDCWPPLSRTAVLVPYRNRSDNLDTFVPYMHRLLGRQNIAFGIFVIEQANTKLFNRAKLLNIGFRVAQRFHSGFDCFVFQDADKVPENVANLYDCANSPKLMISEMHRQGDPSNKYHRGMLYSNFFGGTTAVSREAFEKVNGNSNRYYGWGREDDELSARLNIAGYRIHYNSGPDCRFVNLQHGSDIVSNSMPWPYAHTVRQSMRTDGLSSLNYTDMGLFVHPMFVLVRADL